MKIEFLKLKASPNKCKMNYDINENEGLPFNI